MAPTWPRHELTERLGLSLPLIQAPMAGANDARLAIAVSRAGGLGSIPCAMSSVEAIEQQVARFREASRGPLNLNFFCHTPSPPAPEAQRKWREALAPYYRETGLDPDQQAPAAQREPFGEAHCALVERLRPEVVSFHFGLPEAGLLERVKAAGCTVLASATTVAEGRWLETHGVDMVIAQGAEAGGHRGIFLSADVDRQPGTLALVPQLVDAVRLPVIAAGGIGDARGIAAAFALGACGVQLGTVYLATPESLIGDIHRAALQNARDDNTVITNLFSGRPARGLVNRVVGELGPLSPLAPPFPSAGGALAPLKQAFEARGSGDFSSLWAGQAAALARELDAETLTIRLGEEALARLRALSGV
ncbi:nitronate monooxygenase [Halomonas sp. HP20-15]|uniref:NAD(P)H-dependent flavin oxidoreductase n=1 Tax=Halomonas sp. HP20-15 TaxID=3085901 RepID=UPI00298110CD|nr:nitronate monooxygenase [Halomonas sp. HP20-15]MDW5376367.1 nitronate monooxygenase [Halomonas sp. HP20-15]